MKEGKSISREQNNVKVILLNSISFLLGLMETLLVTVGDLLGAKIEEKNIGLVEALATALQENKVLSGSTNKKKDANVLDGQVAILTDGADATRRENNAVSVAHAYRVLDEDNELIYKKVKKDFNITDYRFKNIDTNTFSVQECTNFLQIPSRLILRAFNKIGQVKTNENPVPLELQNGYIKLGNVKCKGDRQEAYLSNHKDISCMPLYVAGRQGSGKSTYFANYATYAINNSESVVHIDFIKNCEASKDIEKVINKDKYIVLDFSAENGLQSLAYNELKFTSDMTWFDKQQLANKKTALTLELVNSINESGEPLSPKMERYLTACTDIMYLNENATFKDVIKCLQNYKYREEAIRIIPKELRNELEEEVDTLLELDEWSKGTKDNPSEKIGTRDSKIEGILDRVTLLKRDFYLKKMFNKSPGNNIDFIDLMEQGKAILIRMPQSKFKRYVKNVITTFLVSKCWLACETRGELHEEPKRCHIMIDEISQTKTAEKYMESLLTQTRKFRMKFVLTGQYLDQLDKNTIYSLKGAGTSFMLLKGTIKEDFEYMKDELDEDFEYQDLKDMEEYSSLNIIETTDGKASFISKLPKPL